MLPYESSGFAEKLNQRKESARRTLPFSQFIEEHCSERAVRGETSDGFAFVYYPQSNRGVWYEHTGKAIGVGLLGQTSLKALSEIVAEGRHS